MTSTGSADRALHLCHLMEQVAPLDPEALIVDTMAMHGPVAEDRGIRLTHAAAVDLPEVCGDRDRLIQAVSNLVDNALKFTPEGGEVRVRAEGDGAGLRVR